MKNQFEIQRKLKTRVLALVVWAVGVGAHVAAHAKVEALFHPHDPTLEKIADWILRAERSVDIAMYNMDTVDSSPVVKALKSKSVQDRLKSGTLQIRMVFEGYGTPEENAIKMQAIEDMGVDVRALGRSVKVHHKFGVIDTGLENEKVISGSANWSIRSSQNYNENILFFQQEPEANDQFQTEFNRLWSRSKEFGRSLKTFEVRPRNRNQADLKFHFNAPKRLKISPDDELLTDQVVRLIDEARTQIDIASTRIRLAPILEAVARAADRGVHVRILISQDDFRDLHRRREFLERKNLELRVKFYNLNPGEYLAFQMHNKFMVVDQETVLTGSFNWSNSAEVNHIENLVEVSGRMGESLGAVYLEEFESLWNMGRDRMGIMKNRLVDQKKRGEEPNCAFSPVAMEVQEIRKLLSIHKTCKM